MIDRCLLELQRLRLLHVATIYNGGGVDDPAHLLLSSAPMRPL